MLTTLKITASEVNIEGQDSLTNVLITLQVNSVSKTFGYPFSSMKIIIKDLSDTDPLFVTVSTKNTEIGQSQVSLENLKTLKELEKIISLTQTEPSPDKNKAKVWQQRKIIVGKIKFIIKIEKFVEKIEENTEIEEALAEDLKRNYNLVTKVLDCDEDIDIDEIGLKIFDDTDGKKRLSNDDSESLRIVVIGLNEKFKSLRFLNEKLIKEAKLHEKVLEINQDLSSELEKLKESFESSLLQSEKKYNSLKSDHEELKSQLQSSKQESIQHKNTIHQLESEIKILTEQIQSSQLNSLDFQHNQNYVKELKSTINELESSRNAYLLTFKSQLEEFETLKSEFSFEISKLMQENSELQKTQSYLQEKTILQASIIEKQKNELINLSSGTESLHKQLQIYSNLESNLSDSEKKSAVLTEKLQDCLIESSKTICNFNACKSLLAEEKESLLLHAQDLQKENMKLQSNIVKQNSDLAKKSLEKEEISINMISLEQALVAKEENFDLLSELSKSREIYENLTEKVHRELEFMSEYLLGQSEYNLGNVRAMKKMRGIVEDRESEIMVLRDMVTDLQKKRALYIPVRDDPIDGAVADYVNTRATDVPFIREDHGIYVFGSKRVFVRLEHGKIISNL